MFLYLKNKWRTFLLTYFKKQLYIRKGDVILNKHTPVTPIIVSANGSDNQPEVLVQAVIVRVVNNKLFLNVSCYTDDVFISRYSGCNLPVDSLLDDLALTRFIQRMRNSFVSFNLNDRAVMVLTAEELRTLSNELSVKMDFIAEWHNKGLSVDKDFDELGTMLVEKLTRFKVTRIKNKGARWKKLLVSNFHINGKPVPVETVPPLLPTVLSDLKSVKTPSESEDKTTEPMWYDHIIQQAKDEYADYDKAYPQIIKNNVMYERLGKQNIIAVTDKGVRFKLGDRNTFFITNESLAMAGATVDNIHLFYVSFVSSTSTCQPSGIFHKRRILALSDQ